jgi:hypothetical protein
MRRLAAGEEHPPFPAAIADSETAFTYRFNETTAGSFLRASLRFEVGDHHSRVARSAPLCLVGQAVELADEMGEALFGVLELGDQLHGLLPIEGGRAGREHGQGPPLISGPAWPEQVSLLVRSLRTVSVTERCRLQARPGFG